MHPEYWEAEPRQNQSDKCFIDMVEKHISDNDLIKDCLKPIGPVEIKIALKDRKISLRKLAKKMGVSATYISRIKNGHLEMSKGLYVKLYHWNRPNEKGGE